MGGSPVAKIRLEKRAGNAVTVIAGLHTYGTARLQEMARELKLKFGTGGTLKDGKIEIQGDKVVLIRAWFRDKESHLKEI
jgi:translation initiation factor 1